MKVTIAVITYFRPQGLENLLHTLSLQKVSDLSVSVLIIDNDCTGENTQIINKFKEYPFELELIEEKKKGIVYARNRAVDIFLKNKHDVLVFIDDDEWPVDEHWVITMVNTQQKYSCDIVYSDVWTVPESMQIQWVEDAFRPRQQNNKVFEIKKFYTNNLLVRYEVLEKIHPAFDERFALTGSSDLHFSIKCRKEGFKAMYTPYAPVQEVFPNTKATLKWFFLRGYRSGEGSTRAYIYEGAFPKTHIECIGMGLMRFSYALIQMIRALLTLKKSFLANSLLRLGSAIGTFAGFFSLSYNEYSSIYGK
jgi:glycosyltransferase involved in cell wall biosynthesis